VRCSHCTATLWSHTSRPGSTPAKAGLDHLAAPVERAFQVFTEGMSSWWPLATHKIGKVDAKSVVIEPWDGRIFAAPDQQSHQSPEAIFKGKSRVLWRSGLCREPLTLDSRAG
jgi:hypothetical protein